MNTQEIIPVEQGKNGLEVSSRLLHQKLQVKTPHRIWIARRIKEYNFMENRDFYFRTNLYENKPVQYQGRTSKEYVIALDMAKELAMLENSETGRMVRWYFIEAEKRYRDWIGFILPRMEVERDLFSERTGYNYIKLLMSCGCSAVSSSVHRRIRRNPQEFWKNQGGAWTVSERFGRTIVANAVVRKLNQEARERRLLYTQLSIEDAGAYHIRPVKTER